MSRRFQNKAETQQNDCRASGTQGALVFRLVASQGFLSLVIAEVGAASAEGVVPLDWAILEGTTVVAPTLAAKGRLENKAFGCGVFDGVERLNEGGGCKSAHGVVEVLDRTGMQA